MSSNHHDPTEPARKLIQDYENKIADLEQRLRGKELALAALREANDAMAYRMGSSAAAIDQIIGELESTRARLGLTFEDGGDAK